MPLIVKDNKKEYTPAPEGLWPAVCCDVIDLGIQKTMYGEQVKIEIRWQLEGIDPKTKFPYMVTQRYTPSLHEKSKLRPMLEAWRGKRFTPDELKGFDIEKLIGVNCQIQVLHNIANEGQVYANVQAVIPPAKGTPKLAVNKDYIRVAERAKRAAMEAHPDGNGSDSNEDWTPF